jgi:hypothetical protein
MNSEDITRMTLDERFNNYLVACTGNKIHYTTEQMLQIKNIWVAGYAAGVARTFEGQELPDDLSKLRDRVLSEITDYMQRTMSYATDPKSIEREEQEKKECEG